MTKTTVAALGVLALLAGSAVAGPAPNAIGATGMGGGVYYDPSLPDRQAQPAQIGHGGVIGTTEEGGAVYHSPTKPRQG
jgi:hypothetical protein